MFQMIIIVGNLGKDPEMRFTPSGQAVTSYSVATNRRYQAGDQQVNEVTWFRVTSWGKRAEVDNQYLKKGTKVLVVGRLTPDKTTGGPKIWEKSDHTAGASYDLTATNVVFLSSKGEGMSPAEAAAVGEAMGDVMGQAMGSEHDVPSEDDIPF